MWVEEAPDECDGVVNGEQHQREENHKCDGIDTASKEQEQDIMSVKKSKARHK